MRLTEQTLIKYGFKHVFLSATKTLPIFTVERDALILHQSLLFISSVSSIKILTSEKQTWLMWDWDTAELVFLYRKVSQLSCKSDHVNC